MWCGGKFLTVNRNSSISYLYKFSPTNHPGHHHSLAVPDSVTLSWQYQPDCRPEPNNINVTTEVSINLQEETADRKRDESHKKRDNLSFTQTWSYRSEAR